MKDLNVIMLVGRLARDAELKYLPGGTAVCNFSLAVNRSAKKGDKWEDEASFFDIALFGKQGEAIAQYLTKGQQVGLAGELKQDRWEKDGEKKSRVVIIADTVQLLGGKREQAEPVELAELSFTTFEDDIPF